MTSTWICSATRLARIRWVGGSGPLQVVHPGGSHGVQHRHDQVKALREALRT
ncbi:MAG: hypothetical protein V4454_13335 [Pseudomonadota bacterium]